MSFVPFTDLIGDLTAPYALITSAQTAIGTIIPDVSIEEVIRETIEVVDQPVETGSTISDHAFLNPVIFELQVGWSNSTGQSEDYVSQVYQALTQLRASRVPFTLSTMKKTVDNCLITSLITRTDQRSSNSLMCIAQIRELILVSTSGGDGATSGPSQNAGAQDAPQDTAGISNLGNVDSSQTPAFASGQGAYTAAGPGANAPVTAESIGAISGSFGLSGPVVP